MKKICPALILAAVMVSYALVGTIKCEIAEVDAVPGQILMFDINIINKESYEREIPLNSHLPQDFGADFIYQNKIVRELKLNSSEERTVQFRVKIPQNAKEGTYFVTVYASDTYTIRINVRNPDDAVKISSAITGVSIEAGDSVRFPITVKNLVFGDYTVKLMCEHPEGWKCRFYDGDVEVFSIVLRPEEERQLILDVESDSSSDVGLYKVRPFFNSQFLELQIKITETHRGEKGEVKLRIIDRDGRGVEGAKIKVGNQIFYTSPEGDAIFEIPAGKYDIVITKGGYYDKEIKNVNVKAGKTTDLGTVYMEKKPYYVEVRVVNPKVTSTLAKTPEFRFRVENTGYADDTYLLSVEGLPAGFYTRFRDSAGVIVSEIFLASGDSEEISLEILVPPAAQPGTYNLTLHVDGRFKASRNLTLKLVGEYRLYLEPEGGRYMFTAEKGEKKEIPALIGNAGIGVPITNISVSISAPKDWEVSVFPNSILTLPAGQSIPVKIVLFVPPETIPSEYKLTVNVKSDQTQLTEEFKIIVKERSYATLIGVAIILSAIFFLIYIFRRAGRR